MRKLYATLAAMLVAAPALFAQAPEELYVVGSLNGWTTPNDAAYDGPVLTDANMDGIYTGKISFNGDLQFKIFDAKTNDWTMNSYGAAEEESVTLEASVTHSWEMMADGKNFHITNWGEGTIEVDWSTMTVSVYCETLAVEEEPGAAPEEIYIIGQCQGWDINSSAMPLYLSGEDVYTGTYDILAGEFQLRFYTALGNWEANSIGSQEVDNPIEIVFTDNKYEGACVNGKGSWQNNEWGGGSVNFVVDLKNMTVVFTDAEAGVEINAVNTADNFKVYNMQGINVLNTTDAASLNNLKGMYIINGKKVVLK